MEWCVLGPMRVRSRLNHEFEHIFMMQKFSFKFGFDSASRSHFRSESVMRFSYSNENKHFVLMECVSERPNGS